MSTFTLISVLTCINCLLSDVDECSESRRMCESGRCENTHGSYTCICDNGYAVQGTSTVCTGNNWKLFIKAI